jgi:hypothetical protein
VPTKTEAIKNFLNVFTVSDLAGLYNHDMEVQVNVAQDDGEPVSDKSGFTGRLWRGYTDGVQTWKSFRVPFNAATTAEYTDTALTWSLKDHAEAIGMTGWDWKNKVSKWVAFDFDNIITHADGLTAEELNNVTAASTNIPWITVRRSTSGNGIHLYVFLNDVPTDNHTEHAALARAIIGKMSAITGFDFSTKVDICGGNIWVWHRKSKGTNGLELIKQGDILYNIPPNWKDHVAVIKGRRRKNLPDFAKDESLFDQMTGCYPNVKLDKEHKRLLDYLEENECSWWYDSDNHLLVCHSSDLKLAHKDLGFRGLFDTIATGKDKPDHNIFCSPLEHPEGSWVVRRFNQGVSEANTWFQDANGWTTCYLNKEPTLSTAARTFDGIEDEKGNFFFPESEVAATAASTLGVHLNLPNWASSRQTILKQHKDGKRIVVSVKREQNDNPSDMVGWKEDKTWWKRIFFAKIAQPNNTETQNYDNIVRHLVTTSNQDAGWVLNSNSKWYVEPLNHIRLALKSLGLTEPEINIALGKCVTDSWTLVSKPFEPEYPGDREWNRDAAQLKYLPQQTEPFLHPNWDRLINHIGEGLDQAVKDNGWCIANGLQKGTDYIRLWIASIFQFPTKHLPYLFLYSPEQQSGKTSLHEALKLLITSNAYMDVKAALINPQGFNEEMKNAIICAVDECDLRQNKFAYNRMKDWITGEDILIHPKGKTPYMVKNISHYIQTGNDANECPIIQGDSRIVVIRVPPLSPMEMIPKDVLFKFLDKEAPAFLGTLFKTEIPPCNDRLNIPVIESEEKNTSAKLNRNSLQVFIEEVCHFAPGESVRYGDFYSQFNEWLDPNEIHEWTKIRVGRSLPAAHPKGRLISDGGQFHVGNISFMKPPDSLVSKKYVLKQDCLVVEDYQ